MKLEAFNDEIEAFTRNVTDQILLGRGEHWDVDREVGDPDPGRQALAHRRTVC